MASGNTLCVFTPLHNQPPATAFATLDLRNAHPVLDFDPATAEDAILGGVMPRHYAGGGVTVTIWWSATSATTGDVKWNGAFENMLSTDLDADSFAAAQTTTTTTNATSGILAATAITFTDGAQMDSFEVGAAVPFRFKLTRDAAAAADTMTGDAELHRVEIKET